MIVWVTAGVLTGVAIDVLAIRSRSVNGRRDICRRVLGVVGSVEADVHTGSNNDPDVPANVRVLLAFELTQAAPQSFCLKDSA